MLKVAAQTSALTLFLGGLLFLAAGDVAWTPAWAFLAIFGSCNLAIGVWLLKSDPALHAERSKSPVSAAHRPRDRAIMAAIISFISAWFVFMALDARRFGWSHTSSLARAIGATLIVATFWGWASVLRANSFASTAVRLQAERGQTAISHGPYAIVRHPAYAYSVLFLVGTPLLLGSLWGLFGLVFAVPLMGARALSEEALLTEALPGYRHYAATVRFRLLPGVW